MTTNKTRKRKVKTKTNRKQNKVIKALNENLQPMN